jgi:hypothetical protein
MTKGTLKKVYKIINSQPAQDNKQYKRRDYHPLLSCFSRNNSPSGYKTEKPICKVKSSCYYTAKIDNPIPDGVYPEREELQ